MIAGLNLIVKDAQEQARTPRDVAGPWVRPRVPARAEGRCGTRRAWKRLHPPGRTLLYREPTDVLVYGSRCIVTPRQYAAIKSKLDEAPKGFSIGPARP